MSEPIKQEIILKATPEQVYNTLTNAESFSELSGGAPTEISETAGGSFSCFGGMILGRNIELVPRERIVQAWKVKGWPDGVYSIVRIDLRANGSETLLTLEHSGFPANHREHLAAGWNSNYWEPLKKYLN